MPGILFNSVFKSIVGLYNSQALKTPVLIEEFELRILVAMVVHPGLFILIFFLELISLFVCSTLLMRALAKIFYLTSRSWQSTVHIMALLFLPGTIVHELSHVLVAGVMMVRVGDIEFMPEIRQDSIKLGSAQIGQTDPFRRALIGVAPVIIGISIILGSLWYFVNMVLSVSNFPILELILLFFIIFEISNTMFSSKKDLEGTLEVAALLVAILLTFYLLGIKQPFDWIDSVLYGGLGDIFKQASLFLLIPILIDLVLYVFSKLANSKI